MSRTKGATEIDKAAHIVWDLATGADQTVHGVYFYCEEQLYVFYDTGRDLVVLVKARNPKEAERKDGINGEF